MSGPEPLPPVEPRPPRDGGRWTRAEDYLDLDRLWRRSAKRNRRRMEPRSEPEQPRITLGTLPFLLMILAMMVIAFIVIVIAIPGRTPPDLPLAPKASEPGTAPPGWLDR